MTTTTVFDATVASPLELADYLTSIGITVFCVPTNPVFGKMVGGKIDANEFKWNTVKWSTFTPSQKNYSNWAKGDALYAVMGGRVAGIDLDIIDSVKLNTHLAEIRRCGVVVLMVLRSARGGFHVWTLGHGRPSTAVKFKDTEGNAIVSGVDVLGKDITEGVDYQSTQKLMALPGATRYKYGWDDPRGYEVIETHWELLDASDDVIASNGLAVDDYLTSIGTAKTTPVALPTTSHSDVLDVPVWMKKTLDDVNFADGSARFYSIVMTAYDHYLVDKGLTESAAYACALGNAEYWVMGHGYEKYNGRVEQEVARVWATCATGAEQRKQERQEKYAPATEPNSNQKDINTATKIVSLLEERFTFYSSVEEGATKTVFYAVEKGTQNRPVEISESGAGLLTLARALAYKTFGKAVTTAAVQEGVKTLFALLQYDAISSTAVPVALRAAVFRNPDATIKKVVVDLGEVTRATVVVEANGWRIEEEGDSDVIFKSPSSIRPLTRPHGDADYTGLWSMLGFDANSQEALLIRGWLSAAYLADVERPALLFTGISGSGKTTRAAAVMGCINPPITAGSSPAVGGSFGKLSDESVKAASNYLPGYDNISSVTKEASDFICRLVTGDAIEKRALYTNAAAYTEAYKRTAVFTGIAVPRFGPDAFERLIMVKLERFTKGQIASRAELAAQLATAMPNVMSALFRDLATAIARGGKGHENLPRMADYWLNLNRIEAKLGDAYLKAFTESESEQAEGNTFISVIQSAVRGENGSFETSSAEDFYDTLRTVANRKGRRFEEGFPHTPKSLMAWLDNDATLLAAVGIEVTRRRTSQGRFYGLKDIVPTQTELELAS